MINRYMGCIVIISAKALVRAGKRINRNMGCIEIGAESGCRQPEAGINRNMGCIEMAVLINAKDVRID